MRPTRKIYTRPTKIVVKQPFWDNEIAEKTVVKLVTPKKTVVKMVTPKKTVVKMVTPKKTVVEMVTPKKTVVKMVTPKQTLLNWTTITTRRRRHPPQFKATALPRKPKAVTLPYESKMTTLTTQVTGKLEFPKPKPPRKKKRNPRAATKAQIEAMDMSTFTNMLTTFETSDKQLESRFMQNETRLEMAVRAHQVKLMRQTFGSWKSLTNKYRGTTQPLYFPTKDLKIMADLLTHSYHRMHSDAFRAVYAHCEKHRKLYCLAKLANDDNVGVVDGLPVDAPSAQDPRKTIVKPLRETEWFSPATYMWAFFEDFLVTELQTNYIEGISNPKNIFPRKTCESAMCRAKGFQVDPCKYEGASKITIDFRTYQLDNMVPSLTFLFPTKLLKLLLKFGYTAKQILGFVLLHFRTTFDTLVTTETMLKDPTFSLYTYVPVELNLSAAMSILLYYPPSTMTNKMTPNLNKFDAITSKSWLWMAINFVPKKLQIQCGHMLAWYYRVQVRAYALRMRHMTMSVSNILNAMFTFGVDMAALAPTLRNIEYMSYLTFKHLHLLSNRGKGQDLLSTDRKREFGALVSKALDAAVLFAQSKRAFAPLDLDGKPDQSVKTPVVNRASLNACVRRRMNDAIHSLHTFYKTGSLCEDQGRAALLHLIRTGGGAGVQLLKFWLGGVEDGESVLVTLELLVWLVQYYQAYGNDTYEIQVTRYYHATSTPPPATLGSVVLQHYRYQRAFSTMCRTMGTLRTLFTAFHGPNRELEIPTRTGLTLTVNDLKQQMSKSVVRAQAIIVAKAVFKSGDSDAASRQNFSKLLVDKNDTSVLPTSTLLFCYVCNYVLGSSVVIVDPNLLLFVFEEVCHTSTPDELLVLRTAFYGFFAKLILFAQGVVDWALGNMDKMTLPRPNTEILTTCVSMGNFWVHVLRDYKNPPDGMEFSLYSFDEDYILLKDELETVYTRVFC
jgi:hypothetical protein